jgi:hypothetical protein
MKKGTKQKAYDSFVACFSIDRLEAWVNANTIISDEDTDQEEHTWAPGARHAIKLFCNNLESTGLADIALSTKLCKKCGGFKPVSAFSINRSTKDLLQCYCKACNKS